jgi:hypothetical protein
MVPELNFAAVFFDVVLEEVFDVFVPRDEMPVVAKNK